MNRALNIRCYAWIGCLRREVTRYLADPIQTVGSAVFSNAVFLSVFMLLQPQNGLFLLLGILFFTAFQVVSSNIRMTLFVGKLDGVLNYQLTAAMPRTWLYAAYLIASLLRSFLVNISLAAIAIAWFDIPVLWHVVPMLVAFLLLNILFVNISILLALSYKNWNWFGVMEHYVISPMLLLSGCFFPIPLDNGLFHQLLLCNPFFYFADFFRNMALSLPLHNGSLVIFTLSLFVTTVLCWMVFAKGYKLTV